MYTKDRAEQRNAKKLGSTTYPHSKVTKKNGQYNQLRRNLTQERHTAHETRELLKDDFSLMRRLHPQK